MLNYWSGVLVVWWTSGVYEWGGIVEWWNDGVTVGLVDSFSGKMMEWWAA